MSLYGPDAREVTDMEPRYWQCNKRIAMYLTPPYSIYCPRCRAHNRAGADPVTPPALSWGSTTTLVDRVTPSTGALLAL